MMTLLGRYSESYASNQYRALQQLFKWWAAEEDLLDPMIRLRSPRVIEGLCDVREAAGELVRCLAPGRESSGFPRPLRG